MIKHEQKFLLTLKHIFEANGAFWFKIPDSPTCHQVPKPYDVEVTLNGMAIGLEAKWCDRLPKDVEKLLRKSQVQGLSRKIAAGGHGFIFVKVDNALEDYVIIHNYKTKRQKYIGIANKQLEWKDIQRELEEW